MAESGGISNAYAPDLDALTTGLTSVLARSALACKRVRILERSTIVHGSFPSEMVRCRCNDTTDLRLFCKYGVGRTTSSYGHRGGVRREAAVYDALQRAGQPVPAFHGAYAEPNSDTLWLILDYLDGSSRLSRSLHPDPVSLGARWIGRFHADVAARCTDPSMAFLPRYDAEYYRGWAQRTAPGAGRLQAEYPWLATISRRYEESIELLLAQPQTVIHGEYYPQNILIRDTTAYPVDWESAAVAAGEIDLATLTDRWPPDVVRAAEHAYAQARWPDGAPAHFQTVVDAARLYVQFRWLGDASTQQRQAWRFEELLSIGQRLDIDLR